MPTASPRLPLFFERLNRLPRSAKVLLVVAGYIVAGIVSLMGLTLYRVLYPVRVADPSGMAAFGDGLLLVLLFALSAALPTLLALAFLTRHATFWAVWSLLGLLTGGLTLASALVLLVPHGIPGMPTLQQASERIGALAVLPILAAPLVTALAVASAWLAPGRRARRAWQWTAVMTAAATMLGIGHWLQQ